MIRARHDPINDITAAISQTSRRRFKKFSAEGTISSANIKGISGVRVHRGFSTLHAPHPTPP